MLNNSELIEYVELHKKIGRLAEEREAVINRINEIKTNITKKELFCYNDDYYIIHNQSGFLEKLESLRVI